MLTWVSSTFELRLSQVKVVCQCIIFLTYVCGCVSVWLCVFITFENFILVQSPFSAKRMCSKVTKMLFIVSLVFLGLNLPIHIIRLWLLIVISHPLP
ncbi:uncharacterized protein LOC127835915 [Dreissena polymorpha]|uniref:uncharacterized protein LOC127835915 n=1 Tax=Dreissena polymorpha TaxID=45954 RepID=UPI002263AF42|nr:uncharacterized protein LOC127835915 [Dreissena polymorpha]